MLGCVSAHSVAGHFRLQRERSSYPHWWCLLWMLQKSLKPLQISLSPVIPEEFLHFKLIFQYWGLSCLKIFYSTLKNSGCLLRSLNKEIVFPLISQLSEGSEFWKWQHLIIFCPIPVTSRAGIQCCHSVTGSHISVRFHFLHVFSSLYSTNF